MNNSLFIDIGAKDKAEAERTRTGEKGAIMRDKTPRNADFTPRCVDVW